MGIRIMRALVKKACLPDAEQNIMAGDILNVAT